MKRCFIIGPIGDKMAPIGSPRRAVWEEALTVYEEVIKPACHANDLEPIRADGIAVPGEITDQIFRHLYEDEVVIADVSGGNPNVMYELGLRHTRNLLTVQIGEYGQLPFDVQALRTIMFSRSERGLVDARKDLEQVLRVGLAEGSDLLPATKVWQSRGGTSDILESPPRAEDETPTQDTESGAEEIDERGLIDRMSEIEDAFPELVQIVEEIGNVLTQLGAEAESMTVEMEAVAANAPTAQRLTIIARFGQRLREPADQLTILTSNFSNLMTGLDTNVKGVFTDVVEFPADMSGDDVAQFLTAIVELAQATREGMGSLNEFGTMVGGLGRISKALRRPGHDMQKAIRTMATAAALIDDWEAGALAVEKALKTRHSESA